MFEIRISGRKEGGERDGEWGNIVVGEAGIVPCHFLRIDVWTKDVFVYLCLGCAG